MATTIPRHGHDVVIGACSMIFLFIIVEKTWTTIPPNYWHLSFFEYTFFSFFFTRITHAIPLSFFPPRSFASHAHVWTQTQLLNWTACDLSSHITEQASRTHSITILLPLPPLPPPLPPLLLPSSPRPPPPPPLLHILSTAYRYIHAHGRIHTTEPFEPAETARAHSLTAATSLTPGTRYFTDSHCLTHTLPSLLYKTVAHRCLSARTCKSL